MANYKKPVSMSDIWPNYSKEQYFEEIEGENCLLPKLVSYEPMYKLAQKMNDEGLSKTQMRRFFSHCHAIKIKLKGGEKWEKVRPLFLSMRYVAGRSRDQTSKEFPLIFFEFISVNVDKVKSKEDFLYGFMPHFEALVGFSSKQ